MVQTQHRRLVQVLSGQQAGLRESVCLLYHTLSAGDVQLTVVFSVTREDWLLIPDFEDHRKGLNVKISGTLGDDDTDPWMNGEREGQVGVVLAVQDAREGITPTADLVFKPSYQRATVPIKFLRPAQPSGTGDFVLVLDGRWKGSVSMSWSTATMSGSERERIGSLAEGSG